MQASVEQQAKIIKVLNVMKEIKKTKNDMFYPAPLEDSCNTGAATAASSDIDSEAIFASISTSVQKLSILHVLCLLNG